MTHEPTVFVVDDDEAVRDSLSRLLASVDLPVETFASADEFLTHFNSERSGCLILDIRMPGMDGLDLQDRLATLGHTLPVIIISGHGDVDKAVRAMKAGAVDFIKKPYKGSVLIERVRHALKLNEQLRERQETRAEVASLISTLTPREEEVLYHLAEGKAPKQIAYELGLSRKTVDVHRGHIMTKLRADSIVDLARMVQTHRA